MTQQLAGKARLERSPKKVTRLLTWSSRVPGILSEASKVEMRKTGLRNAHTDEAKDEVKDAFRRTKAGPVCIQTLLSFDN